MRDTYERRLDRLADLQERKKMYEYAVEEQYGKGRKGNKRRKLSAAVSPPPPLPITNSYIRTDLDVRRRKGAEPSLQAQHYRQLTYLMERMAAGHDWIGAADVLAVLCREFRELTYTAYRASVNIYSRAFNVAKGENTSTIAQNNVIRFLRACTSRNVPYKHIAIRDLSMYFYDRQQYNDTRNLLLEHVQLYPYNVWPDTHGLLGICCFEVLYSLLNNNVNNNKRHNGISIGQLALPVIKMFSAPLK